MYHVVMFSGGAGSWACAKRVAKQYGTDTLYLAFSDTLIEDEDLYRFLDEASKNVGGTLVKLAEGRDPWQVFFDEKYLGNSRIDPCSKILKRQYLRKWLNDNFSPENTIVYLGIDWTESHRADKAKNYWEPWTVRFPMCEEPYVFKEAVMKHLRNEGIEPPRLYNLGFPHNNCGGFCIKAGKAHFLHLLKTMPERFKHHEQKEQELRAYLEKDVSILREQRQGVKYNLTLKELRERYESEGDKNIDKLDWGGCGCFSPINEETGNKEY